MFGHKLHAQQELDKVVYKCAVNVVKIKDTLGYLPREYPWLLWYFITHGRKICVEVTGRRLVGWCLVVRAKWKLITWKNYWRPRFADKHLKTQMAPLNGSTGTHEKWTTATHFQFLLCSFLYTLRSLRILIRFLTTPNILQTSVSVDKPHPWCLASEKKCGLYMNVNRASNF